MMQKFSKHKWRGNVREVKSVVNMEGKQNGEVYMYKRITRIKRNEEKCKTHTADQIRKHFFLTKQNKLTKVLKIHLLIPWSLELLRNSLSTWRG